MHVQMHISDAVLLRWACIYFKYFILYGLLLNTIMRMMMIMFSEYFRSCNGERKKNCVGDFCCAIDVFTHRMELIGVRNSQPTVIYSALLGNIDM